MPKITRKEILHIARISAITIHEHEIPQIMAQLESVLSYAARVSEVAIAATESSCIKRNVFRDDIAQQSSPELLQSIEQNAPDFQDGYFVVPAILEHHS